MQQQNQQHVCTITCQPTRQNLRSQLPTKSPNFIVVQFFLSFWTAAFQDFVHSRKFRTAAFTAITTQLIFFYSGYTIYLLSLPTAMTRVDFPRHVTRESDVTEQRDKAQKSERWLSENTSITRFEQQYIIFDETTFIQ